MVTSQLAAQMHSTVAEKPRESPRFAMTSFPCGRLAHRLLGEAAMCSPHLIGGEP